MSNLSDWGNKTWINAVRSPHGKIVHLTVHPNHEGETVAVCGHILPKGAVISNRHTGEWGIDRSVPGWSVIRPWKKSYRLCGDCLIEIDMITSFSNAIKRAFLADRTTGDWAPWGTRS